MEVQRPRRLSASAAANSPTGLAVEARGLRKSFADHVVLDGIDLAVAEGTVFALLGPNGSGKTTTVQILSTLLPADAGMVRVAGHDPVREPDSVEVDRATLGEHHQRGRGHGLGDRRGVSRARQRRPQPDAAGCARRKGGRHSPAEGDPGRGRLPDLVLLHGRGPSGGGGTSGEGGVEGRRPAAAFYPSFAPCSRSHDTRVSQRVFVPPAAAMPFCFA